MRLKGLHNADVAEIQEAVTDELKKIQKEEFPAASQKTVRPRKSLYIYIYIQAPLSYIYIYDNGAYFELKKKIRVFLMCLRFLKTSVLKLLGCTVYV
jgi:hypothetical protein